MKKQSNTIVVTINNLSDEYIAILFDMVNNNGGEARYVSDEVATPKATPKAKPKAQPKAEAKAKPKAKADDKFDRALYESIAKELGVLGNHGVYKACRSIVYGVMDKSITKAEAKKRVKAWKDSTPWAK